MKAIVYTKYGPPDVLELKEIEKPKPTQNEVLVKVHAASVNAGDWHILRGRPYLARLWSGFPTPKNTILGLDVAGQVEEVGSNVTQFRSGDAVFGNINWGGFAEYVCGEERSFVLKPVHTTFEEAAAVPVASLVALQGLRDKGGIQAGQKVLINGASGGVGTYAVQIAKALGAEVTGVCSTRNLDLIRSIGADEVIDYTETDFTKNGKQYDLILGVNGYHPITDYKRALRPGGTYVATGGTGAQFYQGIFLGPWLSLTERLPAFRRGRLRQPKTSDLKKMGSMVMKPNHTDLVFIKALLEAGEVTPVIDRVYPLSKVASALRYIGDGHARGKVIITFV